MSNDHYIHLEEDESEPNWWAAADLEAARLWGWQELLRNDPGYELWLESLNHQQDYANEIRR